MTEENKEAPQTPDGTDFVQDFGSPEVEARFKRIYGHMKTLERTVPEMAEHNKALQARLEALEAQLGEEKKAGAVQQTKSEILQAKKAGDEVREIELTSKLTQLQTQPTKTNPLPPPPTVNFSESAVREWANEVDSTGNFLRPWAQASHPQHQQVYEMTAALVKERGGADVDGILAEIDTRMKVQKPQRRPVAGTVLSGSQRPQNTKDAALTPAEEAVARRMGITPDKYKAQRDFIKRTETAR